MQQLAVPVNRFNKTATERSLDIYESVQAENILRIVMFHTSEP